MSIEIMPLLGSDKRTKDDFKARVLNNGQLCTILVHPFLGRFSAQNASTQQYSLNLESLLRSRQPNEPFLLAAEEDPSSPELRNMLSPFSGEIFTIQTRAQSPRPEAPYDWNDLHKLLKDSGVKKANLGGQRFEFASIDEIGILEAHPYADWLIDELYDSDQTNGSEFLKQRMLPFGCGGMMMCELAKSGIEVSLLTASYPQNTIMPISLPIHRRTSKIA